MARPWIAVAALGGLSSVAFGAFGAHGVDTERARSLLQTGAQYAMAHSLAIIACEWLVANGMRRAGVARPLFAAGVALFSGSLYALALGAPRWTGAITPVGGLLFLAGWAALAVAALRRDAGSPSD